MKTKIIIITLLVAASQILFQSGCKDEDIRIVGLCPLVVSTDPTDMATDVPLNKVVSATFNNQEMDPATFTEESFTLYNGTKVEGTVSFNNATVSFTPSTELTPDKVYTGTVKATVKDLTGNTLQEDYVWSFTTISMITLSSNPEQGGTTSGAGTYAKDAQVTVIATPSPGYSFANWSEGETVVSTSSNYQFAMDGNRNLVANFSETPPETFTLDITAINGTVDVDPNQASYNSGTVVELTATPNAGYTFAGWSGDATGSDNPLSVTMNANMSITAIFTEDEPIGPGRVDLKTAGDYVLLSKTGISTTGNTSITGDIGVSPVSASSITGFSLTMDSSGEFSTTPIVNGKVYAADYAVPTPAKLTTAVGDMENAFTTANGLTTPAPVVDLHAGNISGQTLPAGLYKWGTGVLISSAGVTLSGGPNDTWVFQISQDLTIENSAAIILEGGAKAENIFWVVSGQATLGTNSDVTGIILSQTLISLNTGAKVTGLLFAQTAITLNASTVVRP